jgi:hypothetical protein
MVYIRNDGRLDADVNVFGFNAGSDAGGGDRGYPSLTTVSFGLRTVNRLNKMTGPNKALDYFQLKDCRSSKELLMKNGKKRRAWTSDQVRELKVLARKKAGARKIAKRLKRTEGATRQKAFSIGLSLETRTG